VLGYRSRADERRLPGPPAAEIADRADEPSIGGVDYKQYWVNESEGKVFCLVEAPNKESAARVHREAHGLEAHTLYEVKPFLTGRIVGNSLIRTRALP
jgi:hypothetical protein